MQTQKNKTKEKILCYVDEQTKTAYFTSKKLSEQWGDDWNDAPYEHNAGEPYDMKNIEVIKYRERFSASNALQNKFSVAR